MSPTTLTYSHDCHNRRNTGPAAESRCDSWNQRNAAELARLADTPRAAESMQTRGWSAPYHVMTRDIDHGVVKQTFSGRTHNRSLGNGGKISCGRISDWEYIPEQSKHVDCRMSRDGWNVSRPFDEAHHVDRTLDMAYANALVKEKVFGRSDEAAQFFGVAASHCRHVTPPNHGHGARCANCHYRGGTLLVYDPECPWCHGSGEVFCDDERAGRVSPSHAAGGYAEWQQQNEFHGPPNSRDVQPQQWTRTFDPSELAELTDTPPIGDRRR